MNTKRFKKLIYGFAFIAIAALAAWNVMVSFYGYGLTDLYLANMEALANPETSEEFTAKTGCIAVWENVSCEGIGGTYAYARKP